MDGEADWSVNGSASWNLVVAASSGEAMSDDDDVTRCLAMAEEGKVCLEGRRAFVVHKPGHYCSVCSAMAFIKHRQIPLSESLPISAASIVPSDPHAFAACSPRSAPTPLAMPPSLIPSLHRTLPHKASTRTPPCPQRPPLAIHAGHLSPAPCLG